MKSKAIILTAIVFAGFFAMSCRGSSGKKVATEAAEYLEKKGGSLLDRESGKAAEEGESGYKTYRRVKKIEKYIDDATEDEEPQYQSTPTTVVCSNCGGNGAVYLLDGYGNVMVDYYRNPQVVQCPMCGGTGQQVIYQ